MSHVVDLQGKAKYVFRSMLFPIVLVWYLHIYQMQEQALFAVHRLGNISSKLQK